LHLARAGHRVFATGRKQALLAELEAEAKQEGLPLETLTLDVTRQDSIDAARAEVDKRTNGYGLDALINNAGYGLAGPVETITPEGMRAQFDTNVYGLLQTTQAFLPAMRRRRSGRVINVSSVGGQVTFPFFGAYHATKYAVEALSDALRRELSPFNVQVVVVEPGFIQSEFGAKSQETIAAAVAGEYAGLLGAALKNFMASEKSFSVGPKPIAVAMEKAITARRPNARYAAPFTAWFFLALLHWLPTSWVDALFSVALGMSNPKLLPAPSSSSSSVSTSSNARAASVQG
jgi:NAD(P)-dependent dehydrogenase (short-subunit alcohol dehydrogenase family)